LETRITESRGFQENVQKLIGNMKKTIQLEYCD